MIKTGIELFFAWLGFDAAVVPPVWVSIKARKLREESDLAFARRLRGLPEGSATTQVLGK
jgi:hypothetical protein